MSPGRNTERLGILGGTFDPPHAGHLELAESARAQFGLDRVVLVVAGDPWQKRDTVRTGARDRLAMVEAAAGGRPGLEASAVEVEREGPSYTVDTLEELAEPGRELYLILGADAAAGLPTWHEPERLKGLATVLVADRPGTDVGANEVVGRLRVEGWRAERVDLLPHDVSSSELAARLGGGEDMGSDVPAPVVRVIGERGLYTRP